MSGLKENGMSNGEVLAAMNKKIITKNPEPSNLSQVSRLLQKFFNTYLIFKVDLKQEKQVDDTRPRCAYEGVNQTKRS
jgi:hypothetical protein